MASSTTFPPLLTLTSCIFSFDLEFVLGILLHLCRCGLLSAQGERECDKLMVFESDLCREKELFPVILIRFLCAL